MEILVLHPGALGDIILALPALKMLRNQYPEGRITLAANLDFAGAVASGYADRLLSLSTLPLHRLHGKEEASSGERHFWHSFDRIVSWTGHGAADFTARLQRIHPCVLSSGWKPAPGDARHVSRLFVDSLQPWFQPPAEQPDARITVAEADRRLACDWLGERGRLDSKPLLAIHPGAGSPGKRWPLRNFLDLAVRLRTFADLLVIEGPAESGLGEELWRTLDARALLARDFPLGNLSALISHCCGFIGNDSGIAHLAAGLGLRCIIFFGPTNPAHWAPLGRNVRVLRNTDGCVACAARSAGAHTCLEGISVEMAFEAMHSWWRWRESNPRPKAFS